MADERSLPTSPEAFIAQANKLTQAYLSQMSASNEMLRMKKKEAVYEKEKLRWLYEALPIGQRVLGDVEAEIKAKKEWDKIAKTMLATYKELNKEQKDAEQNVSAFKNTLEKTGANLKISSEEVVGLVNAFKKGQINLSQLWEKGKGFQGVAAMLGSSLTRMIAPAAMLVATIKTLDSIQGSRRGYAGAVGVGMERPVFPSFRNAALYKRKEAEAMGRGMSADDFRQTLASTASMGFGRTGGGEEGYFVQLANLATQKATIRQQMPGVSDKTFDELSYLLTRRLKVPIEQVSGVFSNLAKSSGELNMSEFINSVGEMTPLFQRFGMSMENVGGRLLQMSGAIKDKIISVQDIRSGYESVQNAKMGNILSTVEIGKSLGIDMSFLGIKPEDRIGEATAKAKIGFAGRPDVLFKIAAGIARQSGETTARGQYEFINEMRPFAGLESIYGYSPDIGGRLLTLSQGTGGSIAVKAEIARLSKDIAKRATVSGISSKTSGEGAKYLATKGESLLYDIAEGGMGGAFKFGRTSLDKAIVPLAKDASAYWNNPEYYDKNIVSPKSYPEMLMDSVVKGLNSIADRLENDSKKPITGTLTIIEGDRNRNATANIKRK